MLEFKPLELGDRERFLSYFNKHEFRTYEYSFGTLYLWRKYCKIEFAFIDGCLIIKKTDKEKGTYFMQPLGYIKEQLPGIIKKLIEYKTINSLVGPLFADLEENFVQELKNILGENIKLKEDENNYDYIYESDRLISLSGKTLHAKRNHYSQFISSYNYEVRDIKDENVIKDCKDFAIKWNEDKEDYNEELKYELEGIIDIVDKFDYIGLCGMAVYVEGIIKGFTIGEKVNENMAIIHIEKADPSIKGIYAFINKTFIEGYFSEVKYINREEDLGIEGLRKAKMSYQPSTFERKYIVEI